MGLHSPLEAKRQRQDGSRRGLPASGQPQAILEMARQGLYLPLVLLEPGHRGRGHSPASGPE